jgi:hypothetical protein
MGFKFYTKSLFITPQMGAMADTMGTNTPITTPPNIADESGVISCLYPKKL